MLHQGWDGVKAIPFVILFSTIIACNKGPDKDLKALNGVTWENKELKYFRIDSGQFNLPTPDGYLIELQCEMLSDTLRVINKPLNANFPNFIDTISFIKINKLNNDSIELILINKGSHELFKNYTSLKFYNTKTVDRFSYYHETDVVCKHAIDSALSDVNNGRYVACINYVWPFRNQKEVLSLLKDLQVEYADMGPPPDAFPVDRNCYRETMDYYLNKKFGDQFYEKIRLRADTLMMKDYKSRVFEYYECDIEPELEGKINWSTELYVDVELPVREVRKESALYHPFIDLGFKIDTLSQLSDFRINYFAPALAWNNQFEDQLFDIAVKEVQAAGKWIPGSILGKRVNTRHNVRIQFIRIAGKKQ